MANIKSSDPKLYLAKVQEEEFVALKKLKQKEAEIRILLAELKALRNIKEEAIKHIEETRDFILEEREKKEREEETKSIDKLVEDVQETRKEGTEEDAPYQSNSATQPLYNLPGEEQINTASDSRTIDELYSLAEKEIHTKEDMKRFFDITEAVVKSKPYEMNDIIKDKVNDTYQAIKTIIEKRPEIANNYKPINHITPVNEFLSTLKKEPKLDYKL